MDGDIIVIDNYELIYILAARFARLFKRVSFVFDYEDGKHLIDKSWHGLFTSLAVLLTTRRPLDKYVKTFEGKVTPAMGSELRCALIPTWQLLRSLE